LAAGAGPSTAGPGRAGRIASGAPLSDAAPATARSDLPRTGSGATGLLLGLATVLAGLGIVARLAALRLSTSTPAALDPPADDGSDR
jgi:hypothetical protein